MSGRFTVNFVSLLIGAGLVVTTFAFSLDVANWVGLGVGAAGLALAGLGALGLLVREVRLGRGLQVGESRIGPDQFARLSALQRDAGTWP